MSSTYTPYIALEATILEKQPVMEDLNNLESNTPLC